MLTTCTKEETYEETKKTKVEPPLFELLQPAQTGIRFNLGGQLLFKGDPTGLFSNVSAVAAGDINNDGLPDLFFSGGHQNSGLFLNEGGFKFKDITASAGIRDEGEKFSDTEGVNFVDVNGDGLLDIYVLKTGLTGNFKTGQFNKDGSNLLFLNQGNNKFKEAANQFGLDLIGLSHTANFFDYDADGDLDVYMAYTGEPGAAFSFPYYEKPPRSKWLNDQFLENRNGKFVDVRQKVGLPFERNIALSVSVGDVNNDGFGDIYVANDFFGRDFFFLNNGNKTFSDSHADYFTGAPMSAMGSDFSDINNDGWLDLFVGEMMPPSSARQKQNLIPFSINIYNRLQRERKPQFTRNMLQLNQGGSGFRDVGLLAGVHASEWSWSSFFFDADNDGHKDLFVANGILRDMTNMDFVKANFGNDYTAMADPKAKAKVDNYKAPVIKTSNHLFRNSGGYKFEDMKKTWGLDVPMQTRGATYADFDQDGDLDIIMNNMDDGPVILRNLAREQGRGNYLILQLKAKEQNTYGIGAKVELYYGKGGYQMNYLSSQRGFQSSPAPILHFGLGEQTKIDSLIITWPGGDQELYLDIAANQKLVYEQGKGKRFKKDSTSTATVFQKVRKHPNYRHKENDFPDFKENRILAQRYSREGPAIAISDVNGDSNFDIFVGGAEGQSGQLFLQNSTGGWQPATAQPWKINAPSEDLGAIFFDANGDGVMDLYVSGGSDKKDEDYPDQLYLNDGQGNYRKVDNALPSGAKNSKVVIAGDYDADGDLDLFIAARYHGGATSIAAFSKILRNNNGKFEEVALDLPTSLGEISAALWTDANGDGALDLALVGRWMGLTFLFQQDGQFSTKVLVDTEGWWNSIIASDPR